MATDLSLDPKLIDSVWALALRGNSVAGAPEVRIWKPAR